MATRRQREQKKERKKLSAKTYRETAGQSDTSLKLPAGVSQFKFSKAGRYKLHVIPYEAGKGNPETEEGELAFVRTYHAHRGMSESGKMIVCLRKTYDKPCPLCNYKNKLQQETESTEENSEDSLASKLEPKLRQLWLVYNESERTKGAQVLETSFYKGFGEQIQNYLQASAQEASESGKKDRDEFFADPEDGRLLEVTASEQSYKGRTFVGVTSISMKPRPKPVPEAVFSNAVCLDDILKMNTMSEKDMKAWITSQYGEEDSDDDDPEDEDFEDEDEDSDDDEDFEDDGDDFEDDDDSEDDLGDDDGDDDDPEDEDFEDEDEDSDDDFEDEDEPVSRKKGRGSSTRSTKPASGKGVKSGRGVKNGKSKKNEDDEIPF